MEPRRKKQRPNLALRLRVLFCWVALGLVISAILKTILTKLFPKSSSGLSPAAQKRWDELDCDKHRMSTVCLRIELDDCRHSDPFRFLKHNGHPCEEDSSYCEDALAESQARSDCRLVNETLLPSHVELFSRERHNAVVATSDLAFVGYYVQIRDHNFCGMSVGLQVAVPAFRACQYPVTFGMVNCADTLGLCDKVGINATERSTHFVLYEKGESIAKGTRSDSVSLWRFFTEEMLRMQLNCQYPHGGCRGVTFALIENE